MKRVVSSSTDAEALALNDVLDKLVFLKGTLEEIFGPEAANIPLEVFTDSKNLHRAVNGTSWVDNPHLRIEVAKVQESLAMGELLQLNLVEGKHMIADCLTKHGACASRLRQVL